jgi:hypothetical protein
VNRSPPQQGMREDEVCAWVQRYTGNTVTTFAGWVLHP